MSYYRNPVTGIIIQAPVAPASVSGKSRFYVAGVEVNPDLLSAETLASVRLEIRHELVTPWIEVTKDDYAKQLEAEIIAAAAPTKT